MTKKRILAITILSPILLTMGVLLLLVTTVHYATSGKWKLKEFAKELQG